jgi:hypothetical protein
MAFLAAERTATRADGEPDHPRASPRKEAVKRSVSNNTVRTDKAHVPVGRADENLVKEIGMSAVDEVIESEIERVERWRVVELMRAGCDPLAAGQIALRPDIDLHQAIGLLAHGCPVDLALRILL